MIAAFRVVRDTLAENRRAWLAITLGFPVLYYMALLTSVVISIGHLPNYITFYDWPSNVLTIIRSTPSIRDMLPIIGDEWLIETGYMNYSFGHGIAEWSLEIIPPKLFMVVVLGALVATCALLLRRLKRVCSLPAQGTAAAGTGVGALCVGAANVTMTWVSCCASPSWVVGLSLIGVSTSTAYALLPYGNLLLGVGFAVLLVTTYLLARRCAEPPRAPVFPTHRLAIQDR
jgi:hypothetical protein